MKYLSCARTYCTSSPPPCSTPKCLEQKCARNKNRLFFIIVSTIAYQLNKDFFFGGVGGR